MTGQLPTKTEMVEGEVPPPQKNRFQLTAAQPWTSLIANC
jgi:hypothetical protein